jgi:hypothetical protein
LGLSSRTAHDLYAHVIRDTPHPQHRIRTLRSRRTGSVATACGHDFPQRMHPALTRRPEIRVRRSSKMVSPCADGQRPLSLIGPAPRRNVRYPRQRLLTARAREPSISAGVCALAADQPQSLSVIGTPGRRVPFRVCTCWGAGLLWLRARRSTSSGTPAGLRQRPSAQVCQPPGASGDGPPGSRLRLPMVASDEFGAAGPSDMPETKGHIWKP